ncbi:hypothetical protein PENTCL1PPCAC_20635, partial [Pristionchus entomophagus]
AKRLLESYAMGAKPMALAREDGERLKTIHEWIVAFDKIQVDPRSDPERLRQLEAAKQRLNALKEPIQRTIDGIEREIAEETALEQKHVYLMAKLGELEQNVKDRSIGTVEVRDELENVQLQLNLLRSLCRQPRSYVECEVDNTTSRPMSPF